jgi:hypothetical protein
MLPHILEAANKGDPCNNRATNNDISFVHDNLFLLSPTVNWRFRQVLITVSIKSV